MGSETEHTTSHSDHDDDSSMASSSDGETIPAMVISRSRRANAGNRMSSLIALAEADDQEKMIYGDNTWDETADDQEFGGAEAIAPEDVSLVSSSDDEGEDEDGDELAGEKALKKQERTENTKKRKMTDPFKNTRKRVKFDPFAVKSIPSPAPRPKKKSERDSWLPAAEDTATRASSRTLARKNKADVHARLVEKEKAREKIVADMAAANKRKEDSRLKPMTQAEKMAMAAKIEKENSKSLNRWEEAEERRAAEQQARLDALRNRQLDGPFIRYWSGPAMWRDDKIIATGKKATLIQELPPDEGIDMTEPINQDAAISPEQPSTIAASQAALLPNPQAQPSGSMIISTTQGQRTTQPSLHTVSNTNNLPALRGDGTSQPLALPLASQVAHSRFNPVYLAQRRSQPVAFDPVAQTPSFEDNLMSTIETNTDVPHLPAAKPMSPKLVPQQAAPQDLSTVTTANPATTSTQIPYPSTIIFAPPVPADGGFVSGILDWASLHDTESTASSNRPGVTSPNIVSSPANASTQTPNSTHDPAAALLQSCGPRPLPCQPFPAHLPPNAIALPPQPPVPPKPKPLLRVAARTLIALENFDEISSSEKSLVAPVLLAPVAKPTRYLTSRVKNTTPPAVLCVITGTPARYRDPKTGLPYTDGFAYKCIQKLVAGSCTWSAELGCFVGLRMGEEGGPRPARGVPQRFWRKAWVGIPSRPVNETGQPGGSVEGQSATQAQPKEAATVDVKMEDATPQATSSS